MVLVRIPTDGLSTSPICSIYRLENRLSEVSLLCQRRSTVFKYPVHIARKPECLLLTPFNPHVAVAGMKRRKLSGEISIKFSNLYLHR